MKIRFLASLLLIMFITSCAGQKFVLKSNNSFSKQEYKKTDHFVFWGLSQEKTLEQPQQFCKNNENFSSVAFKVTVPNYLLRIVTLGIYWPRTIEVYCSK